MLRGVRVGPRNLFTVRPLATARVSDVGLLFRGRRCRRSTPSPFMQAIRAVLENGKKRSIFRPILLGFSIHAFESRFFYRYKQPSFPALFFPALCLRPLVQKVLLYTVSGVFGCLYPTNGKRLVQADEAVMHPARTAERVERERDEQSPSTYSHDTYELQRYKTCCSGLLQVLNLRGCVSVSLVPARCPLNLGIEPPESTLEAHTESDAPENAETMEDKHSQIALQS